jgi:hypothetical protein
MIYAPTLENTGRVHVATSRFSAGWMRILHILQILCQLDFSPSRLLDLVLESKTFVDFE